MLCTVCSLYIVFFEDFEYLYSELWPLLVFPWCQSVYIVLHGWAARWHTSFFLRARKHFETHCILPINKSGKLGLSEVKLWAAGAYTGIKKGGCETWPRAKRAKIFYAPPPFCTPPYRAVANRISKISEKKGLFVRKKRLELVWTAYSWLVHCTNVWS